MIINLKNSFRKLINIFFANYITAIFVGVIILTTGIIVSHFYDNIFISIIGELLKVIGLSLSITTIISYFIDRKKYFIFFKELFIDVLYESEIIHNFSKDTKIKLLKNVIVPLETEKQSERVKLFNKECSDIVIKKALETEKRNVRDNYYVDYEVSMVDGKVVIHATHSYTLYQNRVGGFEPIDVKLERESDGSLIENIIIKDDNSYVVDHLVINKRGVEHNLCKYDKYDSLNITVRIVEYGCDHWILSKFQTNQSIHSITLNISCRDQLKVKDYFLFDDTRISIDNHGAKFKLEARKWFIEGIGIAIIIGSEKTEI